MTPADLMMLYKIINEKALGGDADTTRWL